MKYDVLDVFKRHLYEKLAPNTARTYYSAIVKLLGPLQFNSVSEIPLLFIEEEVKKIGTKNEFSAAKNGLKHLKKVYPELLIPNEEYFVSISSHKRNRSKKPAKTIYLNPMKRKINQISDKKLKYAYRLALISGLRVSELANLEADDIAIQDGRICANVTKGKGGHGGMIACEPDEYLEKRLPEYLKEHPEGKLFYSEVYLREKAHDLGFECHDLRRAYAITTRAELKKHMPAEEANAVVQEKLRHERFSTTKRYLFNRKLKFEYEKVPEQRR